MDKISSAPMRVCLLLAVSACGRLGFDAIPTGDATPLGDVDALAARSMTMVDGLSPLPAGPSISV